jgi:ABC-2 type transport system permease protein
MASISRTDTLTAGVSTARRRRIWALFLRYILLLRRDLSRVIDLLYWPTIDVIIWGFVTLFITRTGAVLPNFAALFLGAVILWNVFFRCQQDISVSFLDDVWARSIIT